MGAALNLIGRLLVTHQFTNLQPTQRPNGGLQPAEALAKAG